MVKFFYLLFDAGKRFFECEISYYAAAFSYYAPMALIPLLFLSISFLGFLYGDTFITNVFSSWGSVLGEDLIKIIKSAISNIGLENQANNFNFIGTSFFIFFVL